jgi:hypothetical protein
VTQILPRFYRSQQTREANAAVDKVIAESIPEQTQTVARATLPGDRRRLRGIPVAGGACGTSPGTDPLGALLRRWA